MSRKTNPRALQDYIDCLNDVCNQTITDSRLVLVNERVITCLQNKQRLPLKLQPQGFLFFYQLVSVRYGKVIVQGYDYRYSLSSDPSDEQQWVFCYEYRLNLGDNIPHAHIHLNASKDKQGFQRFHFPTDRISIEKVIAHLILEHDVQPKRPDWSEYLAKSHQRFANSRTDPPLFP